MPGFTTHYLFGQQTYQKLRPCDLKQTIQKYHRVFALGLQGPDIFFYNPLFLLKKETVPGSLIHTTNTQEFLRQLLKSPEIFHDPNQEKIAQTYVFGFMGHYLLDCACHPYVYARAGFHPSKKEYLGRHIALETDIDTTLLWKFHKRLPSEFHTAECIQISKEQLAVISTMLTYAYKKAFPTLSINRTMIKASIHSTQTCCKLLYDSSGYKKILVRRIESVFPGYAFLSPMLSSDTIIYHEDPLNLEHHPWTNPWKPSLTSCESFMDRFYTAQNDYYRILRDIAYFFQRERTPREKRAALNALVNHLGNQDYHSSLTSQKI